MRSYSCLPVVAAVVAAGLVAGVPVAGAQSRAFELTGNGTSLGDGVAFVMGGTGIPGRVIPSV